MKSDNIYIICIRKYCIYTSNISFLIIRYSFPKHHLLHRRGRQVKVILPSLLVYRSCASLLCCFGQRGAPWHAEILGAAAASSASAAGLHEPTYNVYIYICYMYTVFTCNHMYILMDLISSNRPRSCGWWVGSRASMRCWILCNLYTVQRCFVVVYYLWTCYAPQDLRWAKHAKRSYIWSFCQVQWWRCTYLDEMGLLSLFTISSLSCTSSASGLRKDGDMWYGSGLPSCLIVAMKYRISVLYQLFPAMKKHLHSTCFKIIDPTHDCESGHLKGVFCQLEILWAVRVKNPEEPLPCSGCFSGMAWVSTSPGCSTSTEITGRPVPRHEPSHGSSELGRKVG